jgi:hypothetical protein
MANRQRDPGFMASPRQNEPPPPSWDDVGPRDDATRPILRKTGTRESPLLKASKTGARPALKPEPELPWNAQEDAANLLAELPMVPRAPGLAGAALSSSVRPPPPVRDFDDEPSFTPSLRAPVDVEQPEKKPRKSAPAKKGSRIAEFVRTTFEERLYGSVRYRLHIGELPGSKASGKRKGREPLLLISSEASQPDIFCGWLDVTRKEAQVRSYSVMVLLHESRHGDEPDISEEEYGRFTRKLMDTLFDGGIRLVLLVPDTQDYESTQFNRMPAQSTAQPAVVAPVAVQRSLRPALGMMFLVVLAFALGMHAEHLFSWLSHALAWFGHAPTWFAQVPTWFGHALAWIRQAVPFLH